MFSNRQIASLCDHTFLLPVQAFKKPNPLLSRRKALEQFLQKTLESPLQPYGLCVAAADVSYVKGQISSLPISATVGFPDGPRCSLAYSLAESEVALSEGAEEIDMVMDYEALKEKRYDKIRTDVESILSLVKRFNARLKVILESSELSFEQIRFACHLLDRCGVDFIKSSTGFSSKGACAEHLLIMRSSFSRGIKLSGGVTMSNIEQLLKAVVTKESELNPLQIRIGESSLLEQLL